MALFLSPVCGREISQGRALFIYTVGAARQEDPSPCLSPSEWGEEKSRG